MAATNPQNRVAFDEDQARRALATANLNALRMALYQATGDPELAAMKVVPVPYWSGAYEMIELAPEHGDAVREAAIAFLRSGAESRCPEPGEDHLRALMAMALGEEPSDYIFHWGREELNFDPFPRGVEWTHEPPADVKAGFHAIIIGAGVSGLVTAIQLDRLGLPYTIIERNPEVGGTWWTNDYPDARVDVPIHHYQLTVVKNYPWKHWFATQPELLDYIRHIADAYDLRRNIRFETELTDARWNEQAKRWEVALRGKDGREESLSGNVVISAAGLFNAPNMPDIEGIESFRGRIFHTTGWDHGYDHRGKRVGLIGVGCTGAQLMPRIAQEAGKLTVFQRSPQWVSKLDGYRDPVPADFQWLMDNVPHYANWHCFSVFHTICAVDGAIQHVDPEWQRQGGRISRRNDLLRANLEEQLAHHFPDDPELVRKLTPDWPPFAKRLVVDNGWFDALKRPNVDLVTEPIDRVTPDGILTRDGVEHALDLIVNAGGFKPERFLWPVRYQGRGGVTLEQAWQGEGAKAFLGVTMPHFPNLFMIYGPNTNPLSGGLFAWLEIWSRYAVKAIVGMIERGHRSIECRGDVFEAYNAQLDQADRGLLWGKRDIASYYFNEQGRQAINTSLRPSQVYAQVREPDFAHFLLD